MIFPPENFNLTTNLRTKNAKNPNAKSRDVQYNSITLIKNQRIGNKTLI